MIETDGGESIFLERSGDEPYFSSRMLGLTKREYFASMAMMGIQSSNFENNVQCCENVDIVASRAVRQADALIKVLNEEY